MEKFIIGSISGVKWTLEKKKGIVVISHGMAEHIERYDYFAKKLNDEGFEVYGINHLGHGDAIDNIKGHWPKHGFYKCEENLNLLIKEVSKQKLPVFLFGHSMGSFITQQYLIDHSKEIKGAIISGTNKMGFIAKAGKIMATLVPSKLDKPCKFMDGISFGSYNKNFEPARTKFDWLSRDTKQVDKYIADPLCGYVCTKGFYMGFMEGLSNINKNTDKIRKDIPIYIMSGDKDPVGENGKGPQALYDTYKELGIKDVSIDLYKDGRHEMLNETNKDEVIKNIITWLKKHI